MDDGEIVHAEAARTSPQHQGKGIMAELAVRCIDNINSKAKGIRFWSYTSSNMAMQQQLMQKDSNFKLVNYKVLRCIIRLNNVNPHAAGG